MRLSDAEIIAVTSTINASEIEAGTLALARANLEPPREYAQMMVTMHTAVQARQTALAATLNLSPDDNAISDMLRDEAMMVRTMLMAADDGEFDLLYAESQVTAHANALRIFDEVLLPSVSNAMLRAELMATRMSVAQHLELAMDVVEAVRNADGADAGI